MNDHSNNYYSTALSNYKSEEATKIAESILHGFDRHFKIFDQTCDEIIRQFKVQNWSEVQKTTQQRMGFFPKRALETTQHLKTHFNVEDLNEKLWLEVKFRFISLIHNHQQPELAETFFNTVFCRLFHSSYYNNDHIFVRPVMSTKFLDIINDEPTYQTFTINGDLSKSLQEIISSVNLALPFENITRDVQNIVERLNEIDNFSFDEISPTQVQILKQPMYRNKCCFLVGNIIYKSKTQPFVMSMSVSKDYQLYIEAMLTDPKHIANIFSTSRSYFVLKTRVPSASVRFLRTIVPSRTVHDLYSGIGFHKQAKTEFYRDFLHHIKHSSDHFIPAKGTPGMVMFVFTLPSFPYVFKIIRDIIPAIKTTTRQKIKACYQLVKNHDRVGRMMDTLEFSQVSFPLSRFDTSVLTELQDTCNSNVVIDEEKDTLTIAHCYIERRVTPLNLYLKDLEDPERQRIIDEYGTAIRQLAVTNIFPGDLFFKNFGVTRNEKILFYDYDEIQYLTDCNFREIPEPMYPEQELQSEPWYNVAANDIFPEEFHRFLFANKTDVERFRKNHAELLTAKYWQDQQQKITNGVIEDILHYDRSQRFTIKR